MLIMSTYQNQMRQYRVVLTVHMQNINFTGVFELIAFVWGHGGGKLNKYCVISFQKYFFELAKWALKMQFLL